MIACHGGVKPRPTLTRTTVPFPRRHPAGAGTSCAASAGLKNDIYDCLTCLKSTAASGDITVSVILGDKYVDGVLTDTCDKTGTWSWMCCNGTTTTDASGNPVYRGPGSCSTTCNGGENTVEGYKCSSLNVYTTTVSAGTATISYQIHDGGWLLVLMKLERSMLLELCRLMPHRRLVLFWLRSSAGQLASCSLLPSQAVNRASSLSQHSSSSFVFWLSPCRPAPQRRPKSLIDRTDAHR